MKRNTSMHTFAMDSAFAHDDEGTAVTSPSSVVSVMHNAKETFPGIVTAHMLARALDVILGPLGFHKENTLLATSFCCDEVNRDMEDELRSVYGQNFCFGGIGGFPFGGCTSVGALFHHIPHDGKCVIVYGPHVGIDFDGLVGKVNRPGHQGSGACCNTGLASLEYVRAVKEGKVIHCPDASDPIDAQQVFVNAALLEHSNRIIKADDQAVELPHAMYECIDALLKRILDKCVPRDLPNGVEIALLGGVQVNTPEGTPEYFLPKKFTIVNNKGIVAEDLLTELITEGNKDIQKILLTKHRKEDAEIAKEALGIDVSVEARLKEETEHAKASLVDAPVGAGYWTEL